MAWHSTSLPNLVPRVFSAFNMAAIAILKAEKTLGTRLLAYLFEQLRQDQFADRTYLIPHSAMVNFFYFEVNYG